MSTDAAVEVQRRLGEAWVCVEYGVLARDPALFALFSDTGRAEETVVPVRGGSVRWGDATDHDPHSTWLWPDEVDTVIATRLARGGRPPSQLGDLVARAREMKEAAAGVVRLAFRFF